MKKPYMTERWRAYRIPAFWSKVERHSDDDCWIWTAALTPLGYGTVGFEGQKWAAHRLAWHLTNGPIPEGRHVLHRCDNRKCCNPAHLWLGDHADNMADMAAKGRRKNINSGVNNGRAKLTMDQVREIRTLYATGVVSQDKLALIFGISQFAISQIVRNLRYVE